MINVEPDENIQDKIDEELAEMEADGSDSEGRSAVCSPIIPKVLFNFFS